MTLDEERIYLIQYLLNENEEYADIHIPSNVMEQRDLLRALMNVRLPGSASEEFLTVQDSYLQKINEDRGIVTLNELMEYEDHIFLYKGDITRLKADAIVNAANSALLGCFQPLHSCIDNAIHTYAGIEMRLECDRLMRKQGHEEPAGQAKITNAYNLPCQYVIHTVGPIVTGAVTQKQKEQLASCYRSCLKCAEEHHCQSIAFCCISTGVFHFPAEEAAQIAYQTVQEYQRQTDGSMKVIFNVFTDSDCRIYKRILGRHTAIG